MHRILKPENIMLSDTGPEPVVKAIDFGLGTLCAPQQMLDTLCGTKYYIAPEVWNQFYSREADLWSLGIVLHCMIYRQWPFGMLVGDMGKQLLQLCTD